MMFHSRQLRRSSFLVQRCRPGGHRVSWSRCFASLRTVCWRGIACVAPLRNRRFPLPGSPTPGTPGGWGARARPDECFDRAVRSRQNGYRRQRALAARKAPLANLGDIHARNRHLLTTPERLDTIALAYELYGKRVRAIRHRDEAALDGSDAQAQQPPEVRRPVIGKRHGYTRAACDPGCRHGLVAMAPCQNSGYQYTRDDRGLRIADHDEGRRSMPSIRNPQSAIALRDTHSDHSDS